MLSLCPFYGQGNWATERLGNLPKVTQLTILPPGFECRHLAPVLMLLTPVFALPSVLVI